MPNIPTISKPSFTSPTVSAPKVTTPTYTAPKISAPSGSGSTGAVKTASNAASAASSAMGSFNAGSFREAEAATSGDTYNINVSGALDKEGVARQIVDIIQSSNMRGTNGSTSLVAV